MVRSTLAARPATIERAARTCPSRWCRPPGRAARRPEVDAEQPSSATPTGVAGRGRSPPPSSGLHRLGRASSIRAAAADGSTPQARPPGRARVLERASACAQLRATSSAMPAGRNPAMRRPTWGSVRSAPPSGSVISITVVHTAGNRSTVGAMTTPATRPPSPRSRPRVGARRPSVSDSSSTTASIVGRQPEPLTAGAVAVAP